MLLHGKGIAVDINIAFVDIINIPFNSQSYFSIQFVYNLIIIEYIDVHTQSLSFLTGIL